MKMVKVPEINHLDGLDLKLLSPTALMLLMDWFHGKGLYRDVMFHMCLER